MIHTPAKSRLAARWIIYPPCIHKREALALSQMTLFFHNEASGWRYCITLCLVHRHSHQDWWRVIKMHSRRFIIFYIGGGRKRSDGAFCNHPARPPFLLVIRLQLNSQPLGWSKGSRPDPIQRQLLIGWRADRPTFFLIRPTVRRYRYVLRLIHSANIYQRPVCISSYYIRLRDGWTETDECVLDI